MSRAPSSRTRRIPSVALAMAAGLAGTGCLGVEGFEGEELGAPADPVAQVSSPLLWTGTGDWTALCYDDYFAAQGLYTPWEQNNRLGIDMGGETCWSMQRDWDIYNAALPAAPGLTSNVYFSLYNRRIGVLRTFIWISKDQDAPGSYYSMTVNVADGAGTKTYDHSLLAYEGAGDAYTFAERTNSAKNVDRMYFTDRHSNSHWLVEDTHLSYDQVAHGANLRYLNYGVYSHDVGQIKLSGTIGPEAQRVVQQGAMSTGLKLFDSAKAGFTKGKGTYADMVDGVSSLGTFLTNVGDKKNGDLLTSLATKAAGLSAGAPGLGIVFAAAPIVQGFLGWSHGSQTGLAPNIISINGTVSYVRGLTFPQIPLSSSNFSAAAMPEWARTYNTGDDRNLGLYVMTDRPRARLFYTDRYAAGGVRQEWYNRTYRVSVEDPRCYLKVNPASGAKLLSVKTRVELTLSGSTRTYGVERTAAVDFRDPSALNGVDAGIVRVVGQRTYDRYPMPPAPGLEPLTFKVKTYLLFDVGRGETFESVNSYDVRLTATKVSAFPAGTDYAGCSWTDTTKAGLDASYLSFYEEGPNWFTLGGIPGATNGNALVSGHVSDYETTYVGTNVTGSVFSFKWKVSSEANFDRLVFYMDGDEAGSITGETGWQTFSITVPYGVHNLQWQYMKDYSVRSGQDRAYLDQLVITPLPQG